jgi:hypothetical protein
VKTLKLTYPLVGENYLKQLTEISTGDVILKLGTVFLKAGTRLPSTGLKANPEHEISIITEGCIKAITTNGEKMLRKGEMVQFSANEMQAGEVIEDCKIIWILLS